MNIQLKQLEIVEALKQYIIKQGISLSGKEVTISFTAGRKDGGLTADLVIEDASIPGFSDTDADEEPQQTALKVVPLVPPELKAADEPAAEVKEPELSDEPVVKTTSLFN